MRSRCIAAFLVMTSTAAVAIAATPASAVPLMPVPGTQNAVSSLTSYVAVNEEDMEDALADVMCARTSKLPAASRSQKAAVTAAHKAVTAMVGKRAMSTLMKSPAYSSAEDMAAATVMLFTDRRLGGAAATSLRMAQLRNDPTYLVNTATLLLGAQGSPRTANDLLTWAAKHPLMRKADANAQAALKIAQGRVQLAFGQHQAAEALFRAGLALDPMATTAREGLSYALHCQSKSDEAERWLARSERLIDLPNPFDESSDEVIDEEPLSLDQVRTAGRVVAPRWKLILVEPLIDISKGIGGAKFSSYTPPESANISPMEGVQAFDDLRQAEAEWRDMLPSAPRMNKIHRAIAAYAKRLELTDKSLAQSEDQFRVQFKRIYEYANQDDELDCGAADNFGEMWASVRRLYEILQEKADRYHQIWSAAAATVADPKVNRYFNGIADYTARGEYVDFLLYISANAGATPFVDLAIDAALKVQMNDLAREDGATELPYPHCATSFANGGGDGKIKAPAPPDEPGDKEACAKPGWLSNFEVKLPLGPVEPKIKRECEKIQILLDTSVGAKWGFDIGMFAQAELDTSTMGISLKAGAQGSISTDVGSLGETSSIYVELGFDADEGGYSVEDVGWEVSVSGSGSDYTNAVFGEAEFNDTMRFTFR